jgi:hypothetical protein
MSNEEKLISEAMRALGRRTSEKKKAAVARNNAATRFQAKPLDELACTCGQCPDNPKTSCPRGRAIRRRMAAGQLAPHDAKPEPGRVASGFGKFAGLGVSSAAVAEDRRAEVEADERAFQERLQRQEHRKRAA